jgi:hypothetical protein
VEAALRQAGFDNVRVVEHTDWHAAERAMWTAAADTEPGEDDEALRDLQAEAQRVLLAFDATRRLGGQATAPHRSISPRPTS